MHLDEYNPGTDLNGMVKERLDYVTDLLATACAALESYRMLKLVHPKVQRWWAAHLDALTRREANEKAAAESVRNEKLRQYERLKKELDL